MSDLNLLDESLDINLTLTYHLSIRISTDGFSFAILDTVRNKYIGLKNFQITGYTEKKLNDRFKEAVHSDDFLYRKFKSVSVMYENPKSTLIPSPLFEKQAIDRHFDFIQDIDVFEKLHSNKLINSDSYLVFTFPYNIYSQISTYYPEFKLFHHGSPFIENKLIACKNRYNQQKVFIQVHQYFFDILVIDDTKIRLFNSFDYKTEDDFLYFVLLVFEQLKLNPEDTEVVLSGKIAKDDLNYSKIKRYIKNLRFEKLDDFFMYSYQLYEIPSNLFNNLYNLYKCV